MLNISTSGCALENTSETLSVQEKVLISVDLAEANKSFEAQGKVVRVENGVVALQFILIEDESATLVRNYFSTKLRKMRRGDLLL